MIEELKNQKLDQQLGYEKQLKDLTTSNNKENEIYKKDYEERLNEKDKEIQDLENQI